MSSTFVEHHTRALLLFKPKAVAAGSVTPPGLPASHAKDTLRSLVVSLKPPLSPSRVRDAITAFSSLHTDSSGPSVARVDQEEYALRRAILGKIVVGLYAEALNTYLTEAGDIEAEAAWWAEIERSRWNMAGYLLQTFPQRVVNLVETILHTLRTKNLPIRPSLFTPSSLSRLFPSPAKLRPNALMIALFPHLHSQPHLLSFSYRGNYLIRHVQDDASSMLLSLKDSLITWTRTLLALFTLPFELTWQECRFKRKELEKLRNERAEVLGTLAGLRDSLVNALEQDQLALFLVVLERAINGDMTDMPAGKGVFPAVQHFANATLASHVSSHNFYLVTHSLHRPSRLTRIWPRILLFPPLVLYLVHQISVSRTSLQEFAKDTQELVVGFVRDWLYEPLKEVARTVRTGGEEGMLISKEGVAADLDSLERMTLSLAQDKLRYGQEQLASLSQQIRAGDLTPVLQIYEEDIKTPLKSAVTGTLLRSVFVQVQKAKVDIDQALAGIDKLLKSQELTFAFVGVAPAFAIVYGVSGYVRSLWSDGSGSGRYGGKKRRTGVWLSLRRIERLLNSQSKHSRNSVPNKDFEVDITPLTSGLLLLSLTHLRAYAEMHLPASSTLREGFLEDVEDLEDPGLGRAQKLRIIDRMWRSWGEDLGLRRIAGEY